VARWLEPHSSPAKAEEEFFNDYGDKSHRWGADGRSRLLFEWAGYAFHVLNDRPGAAETCPVTPYRETFRPRVAERLAEALRQPPSEEQEALYTWIMDGDTSPFDRLSMIYSAYGLVVDRLLDALNDECGKDGDS